MLHELKIKQHWLIRTLAGEKKAEVRLNDRDYQPSDAIKFLPLEDSHDNYNVYEWLRNNRPDLHECVPLFKITHVHQGLGMAEGYAMLSIEEVTK